MRYLRELVVQIIIIDLKRNGSMSNGVNWSKLVWFCIRYKNMCRRESAGLASHEQVVETLDDFLYSCGIAKVNYLALYDSTEVSDAIIDAE